MKKLSHVAILVLIIFELQLGTQLAYGGGISGGGGSGLASVFSSEIGRVQKALGRLSREKSQFREFAKQFDEAIEKTEIFAVYDDILCDPRPGQAQVRVTACFRPYDGPKTAYVDGQEKNYTGSITVNIPLLTSELISRHSLRTAFHEIGRAMGKEDTTYPLNQIYDQIYPFFGEVDLMPIMALPVGPRGHGCEQVQDDQQDLKMIKKNIHSLLLGVKNLASKELLNTAIMTCQDDVRVLSKIQSFIQVIEGHQGGPMNTGGGDGDSVWGTKYTLYSMKVVRNADVMFTEYVPSYYPKIYRWRSPADPYANIPKGIDRIIMDATPCKFRIEVNLEDKKCDVY